MASVDRELIEEVLGIVRTAEAHILARIAHHLRNPSGTRAWAVRKLSEMEGLRREITADLRAMNAELAAQIPGIVASAYGDGHQPAIPYAAGQPASVTAIATDLTVTTTRLAPYVLRTTLDVYRQAVGAHLGNLALGVTTRRQTSQQILDDLLGAGVTGFRDKSGRAWKLDTYVEMATRTGLGNAYLEGRVDALVNEGRELAYVIPGPTACPSCDPWAGKILSLTTTIPEGLPFTVSATLGQAKSSGHLFGPNCRCVLAAYQHGYSVLPTAHSDPAGYLAEQELRGLERAVRDAKRQQVVALDGVASKARGRKVLEKQAQLRAHLEAHPQIRRQRHREQIGKAH